MKTTPNGNVAPRDLWRVGDIVRETGFVPDFRVRLRARTPKGVWYGVALDEGQLVMIPPETRPRWEKVMTK